MLYCLPGQSHFTLRRGERCCAINRLKGRLNLVTNLIVSPLNQEGSNTGPVGWIWPVDLRSSPHVIYGMSLACGLDLCLGKALLVAQGIGSGCELWIGSCWSQGTKLSDGAVPHIPCASSLCHKHLVQPVSLVQCMPAPRWSLRCLWRVGWT